MKIGLTYTGDQQKHQNYVNWLKGGDDWEIITLSAEENNAAKLQECNGLVLSGGVDVNPEMTGGAESYTNMPEEFHPDRDQFEKLLYEMAKQRGLPILGICRGMQLVNVLEGGTLVEDLDNRNEVHRKEGSTDKIHRVKTEDGSLLREIVKAEQGEINSAHHQGIGKPGGNLSINSMADDGTIEGLEWKDKSEKPFLLCVQWHPERMFQLPHSPFSDNIRERFIAEMKKSIPAST